MSEEDEMGEEREMERVEGEGREKVRVVRVVW